jgi:hypothetical protein
MSLRAGVSRRSNLLTGEIARPVRAASTGPPPLRDAARGRDGLHGTALRSLAPSATPPRRPGEEGRCGAVRCKCRRFAPRNDYRVKRDCLPSAALRVGVVAFARASCLAVTEGVSLPPRVVPDPTVLPNWDAAV